jgi:hypothetical protein
VIHGIGWPGVVVELGEACHTERVTLSLAFEEWTRLEFASGKYHED